MSATRVASGRSGSGTASFSTDVLYAIGDVFIVFVLVVFCFFSDSFFDRLDVERVIVPLMGKRILVGNISVEVCSDLTKFFCGQVLRVFSPLNDVVCFSHPRKGSIWHLANGLYRLCFWHTLCRKSLIC
jgi:hypothetical protein